MSDKEYNSQIASLRAPVERLVAHFKNWKIFHADYRRPHRTYRDAFDAARGLFFFSITWGFGERLERGPGDGRLAGRRPAAQPARGLRPVQRGGRPEDQRD